MRRLRRPVRLLSLLVLGWAIAQELRRPKEEREWHGTVAGVVPYELRVPTLARARERWWDPDGPLVKPKLFGAGWTLNAGRAVRLLRERTGR